MPTFITHEMYTCSHIVETIHRGFGIDSSFRLEWIPVQSSCPLCFCKLLLDNSYELELDDDDDEDRRRILKNLLQPYKQQLAKHLQVLVENKRCAMSGIRGRYSGLKQIRMLEKLSRMVLTPASLGEFQATLQALINFQEGEPRYPTHVQVLGNAMTIRIL
ncbi:hypothetical protein F4813DRAFT_350509 [Daldinia decipiens]|uniref:uncharacterized protein n=1 Tax=Daldinia decipiens TaxID=326647 RepID=UPI0020C420B6|nr:uncharacterized protein F4813DRAFT_350509 [Daldinia decipiens]KAI1660639.1 hypothetical protein F4813DRAFT_350509 [Daldinia decipiens]